MDSDLYERINSLPNAQRLRITAYILMIILIPSTCLVIYLTSFFAMGIWLKYHYDPKYIEQANQTMNPFYASIVITITGFNQNGLSPW
jgi:anaerobic C4-dicarboxylate transporter